MDIKLNFINQSDSPMACPVVIFQKAEWDELAVAWRVIQNCSTGYSHPFVYPMDISIGFSDAWGNVSPHYPATRGDAFEIVMTPSGDRIQLAEQRAASDQTVEIRNHLSKGAISAYAYRDGLLLAKRTSVCPGQTAVFQFKPTLFVGVVSQVQQGEVMNEAVINEINTEISLLGIASADLVMTGGGPGPGASPFVFTLENITMM